VLVRCKKKKKKQKEICISPVIFKNSFHVEGFLKDFLSPVHYRRVQVR
jgi:hypothetical protein